MSDWRNYGVTLCVGNPSTLGLMITSAPLEYLRWPLPLVLGVRRDKGKVMVFIFPVQLDLFW